MKKNIINKGFTLVELLGVIVIIAIVMGLAVVSYSSISSASTKTYYKGVEQSLLLAIGEYSSYNNLNNMKLGDIKEVTLESLVNDRYIEKVVDKNGKSCNLASSNVKIYKNQLNKLDYIVCLVCDDYKSSNSSCTTN